MFQDEGNQDHLQGDEAERFARFMRVDQAYRDGDLDALREALGSPAGFPKVALPFELGLGQAILHHAIYFSPVAFIREMAEAGADVNYITEDNIPSMFAPVLTEREDRIEIMKVLVEQGADVDARGYNDWTPLQLAVNLKDIEAVRFLVEHGADAHARAGDTESDTSPLDDAMALEFEEAIDVLLGPANG